MTTIVIPLVTLPTGTYNFGPRAVADSEVNILMTIDRTPAGGLNSLPATSLVDCTVYTSEDGGATWLLWAGATMPGGIILKRGGVVLGASNFSVDLPPGTGRMIKAVVVISGPASIPVAGTIVTT